MHTLAYIPLSRTHTHTHTYAHARKCMHIALYHFVLFCIQGSYNDLPAINLRTWYGSTDQAEAVGKDDAASRMQSLAAQSKVQLLIRKISNPGFKHLRQWLFEAQLQIEQINKPLEVSCRCTS